MTTTTAATYFPAMTGTDSITTSWLPLTTIWGGARGDGATNYIMYNGQYSAWLPDVYLEYSWGADYYPPEITMANMAFYVPSYQSVSWGFAPFVGCPTPLTAVQTTTGMSSGTNTVCCPP
jgi:hypothetical protein